MGSTAGSHFPCKEFPASTQPSLKHYIQPEYLIQLYFKEQYTYQSLDSWERSTYGWMFHLPVLQFWGNFHALRDISQTEVSEETTSTWNVVKWRNYFQILGQGTYANKNKNPPRSSIIYTAKTRANWTLPYLPCLDRDIIPSPSQP